MRHAALFAPVACALALAVVAAHAKPTVPRAPASPPLACGDFDRLAEDQAVVNRQRSTECDHVPSMALYQEANRLRYGHGGVTRDWALAAELYRQSAAFTEGATHPQMGFFRWRDAMLGRAMLLRQGGHGLARDVAEARRIGGLLDWHPDVLADLDMAIRAEATAAMAPPMPVLQPGLWSIRLQESADGRQVDDSTDQQCLAGADIKELAGAAPEEEACAWTFLERSPSALDARWTCDFYLDEDPGRPFDERIERHAYAIDYAPTRLTGRKTLEFWAPFASEPTRRTETRVSGERIGDC